MERCVAAGHGSRISCRAACEARPALLARWLERRSQVVICCNAVFISVFLGNSAKFFYIFTTFAIFGTQAILRLICPTIHQIRQGDYRHRIRRQVTRRRVPGGHAARWRKTCIRLCGRRSPPASCARAEAAWSTNWRRLPGLPADRRGSLRLRSDLFAPRRRGFVVERPGRRAESGHWLCACRDHRRHPALL